MNGSRFFAVLGILVAVTLAWMALGGSIWARTQMLDESLSEEMGSLWGPEVLAQAAPYWAGLRLGEHRKLVTAPSASVVTAKIAHNHRDKGLLWYSTFSVDFQGVYTIPVLQDRQSGPMGGDFVIPLPPGVTAYDDLQVTLDGESLAVPQADVAAGKIAVPVTRDAEHVVRVHYKTAGQDVWLYVPGKVKVNSTHDRDEAGKVSAGRLSELANFSLTVSTDFADIDYPSGTRSPTTPAVGNEGGMTARWEYEKALTGQAMGIAMPRKPNAGPIVARMSFFAPVSLLFFFAVLFVVVVVKKISLHPMHALFISAGFFAFHILLAYLADVIALQVAFWISAGVSVLLVASYMRLVAGVKFALGTVGVAQLVYLVGFSYAFFWVGRTGLTVTIGAVATLFVLMQATGRVDWNELFAKPLPRIPTLPPSPGPASPPPLTDGPYST